MGIVDYVTQRAVFSLHGGHIQYYHKMNYLKSITTSVLNSTGVSFPFSIGEWIPGIEPGSSIWDVREGVKKDDGTLLTLFIFDSTLPPLQPGNRDRRTLMQLARNALKKLRTIRHPDVWVPDSGGHLTIGSSTSTPSKRTRMSTSPQSE